MTKKFMALATGCLLAAALPLTAFAAATDSPEFSRTAEEWAKLQDNVLEYNEIPDLIHEYNVTVLNNRTSYRDYLGKTRDDVEKRYRDAAEELRNNIEFPSDPSDASYASMMMAAVMNETQAKSLESQADNNVDDQKSVYLQYQQVEANLVLTTKLNLISYYQKLLANELTPKNEELLQAKYQAVVNQAAAGTATQMEVLNARQAVEQLAGTIISDNKETQTLKQQICLATGWNYDAQPEIGPLPEFDETVIDQIHLDQDKASAEANNYTLKLNQRKYENSKDAATKTNLEKTMKDNRQKIGSDVDTKYQSLLQSKTSYDLAVSEQTVQEETLAKVTRQFQTGTATKLEYQQEVYNLESKNNAVGQAKLNLLTAWETYQGAVNGLASA